MSLSQDIQENRAGLSHKSPYIAHIKERVILNKPSSTKKTLHIVLDLADSGIEYDVGSCVGVFAQNSEERVERFLEIFTNHASSPIVFKKTNEVMSVRTFLTRYANLNSLNSSFLKLVNHPALSDKEFVLQNDPLSFLQAHYTDEIALQMWCDAFQPLLPRYYSIASSQKKVSNEVHLMVATFSYSHAGQEKTGVASSHLFDEKTTHVPIFLQKNPRFTVPENLETPIIMIGPGTGVAPFIAFIQERIATSSSRNWLFFGERNREEDFYYEDFLLDAASKGYLELDLAFSRDQEEKIYVQHKMVEKADQLWQWIEKDHASIYICGDAKKMAKDVTEALLTIFMTKGHMERKEADAYLSALRKSHRIHLDVY
ncbi:MAG: sulfite reductase [Chlamydiae bacterium]|nr:sulfite reductase [Chlamydiota bacterium]